MSRGKAWQARVYKDDGYWWWDVSFGGMRSTGGRPTWREAFDAASSELAWMCRELP